MAEACLHTENVHFTFLESNDCSVFVFLLIEEVALYIQWLNVDTGGIHHVSFSYLSECAWPVFFFAACVTLKECL